MKPKGLKINVERSPPVNAKVRSTTLSTSTTPFSTGGQLTPTLSRTSRNGTPSNKSRKNRIIRKWKKEKDGVIQKLHRKENFVKRHSDRLDSFASKAQEIRKAFNMTENDSKVNKITRTFQSKKLERQYFVAAFSWMRILAFIYSFIIAIVSYTSIYYSETLEEPIEWKIWVFKIANGINVGLMGVLGIMMVITPIVWFTCSKSQKWVLYYALEILLASNVLLVSLVCGFNKILYYGDVGIYQMQPAYIITTFIIPFLSGIRFKWQAPMVYTSLIIYTATMTTIVIVDRKMLIQMIFVPFEWLIVTFGTYIAYQSEQVKRQSFLLNAELYIKKCISQHEYKRAEKLLTNIFPVNYRESFDWEGDRGQCMIVQHEWASVLTTDIINFTKWCRTHDSSDVINLLNEHFFAFDRIVQRFSATKIKTMGDAYQCILVAKHEHDMLMMKNTMLMGIMMLLCVASINTEKGYDISIRVGIADGPLYVALLGTRLSFDVFGRAVTIAEALERTAPKDTLHVTEHIYKETKDAFNYISEKDSFVVSGQDIGSTYSLSTDTHEFVRTPISTPNVMPVFEVASPVSVSSRGSTRRRFNESQESITVRSSASQRSRLKKWDYVMHMIEANANNNSSMTLTNQSMHSSQSLESYYSSNSSLLDSSSNLSETTGLSDTTSHFIKGLQKANKVILNVKQLFTTLTFCHPRAFPIWKHILKNFKSTFFARELSLMFYYFCLLIVSLIYRWNTLSTSVEPKLIALLSLMTCMALLHFIAAILMILPPYQVKLTTIKTIVLLDCGSILDACMLVAMWLDLTLFKSFLVVHVAYTMTHNIVVPGHFLAALFINTVIYGVGILMALLLIPQQINTTFYVSYASLIVMYIALVFIHYYTSYKTMAAHFQEKTLALQLDAIELSQRENDNLILSIMPLPVIERLEQSNMSFQMIINGASAAFVQINGFEEQLKNNSEIAIRLLHGLYEIFDDLVINSGADKIKTVHNMYLYVSGIHDSLESISNDLHPPQVIAKHHCQNVLKLAYAMMDAASHYLQESDVTLSFGVACGPFYGGVIGKTSFCFDIFGHTVNMASRMMTSAEPGTIQITQDTKRVLDTTLEMTIPDYDYMDGISLIPREVSLKGSNETECFVVQKITAEYITPGGEPDSQNLLHDTRALVGPRQTTRVLSLVQHDDPIVEDVSSDENEEPFVPSTIQLWSGHLAS